MPLMNYTTGIEADQSIGEIQKCLVEHGATAILADYDGQGQINSLSFQIPMNGQPIGFRLPSDWRPVLKVLEEQKKKLHRSGSRRAGDIRVNEQQARRVAWRILKDWVVAQMAIIEVQMVTLDQVFLPYAVVPDGRTLYETVKSSNLLSPPKP